MVVDGYGVRCDCVGGYGWLLRNGWLDITIGFVGDKNWKTKSKDFCMTEMEKRQDFVNMLAWKTNIKGINFLDLGLVFYSSTGTGNHQCEYCRTNYYTFVTNCKNCGGTVKWQYNQEDTQNVARETIDVTPTKPKIGIVESKDIPMGFNDISEVEESEGVDIKEYAEAIGFRLKKGQKVFEINHDTFMVRLADTVLFSKSQVWHQKPRHCYVPALNKEKRNTEIHQDDVEIIEWC